MCIITGINETNYEYYIRFMPEVLSEWITADEDILVFGIESFGIATGSVIIRRVFPEAEIVWFYVDEQLRGRGIGSDALMAVMEMMREVYDISTLTINLYAGTDERLVRLFDGFATRREAMVQSTYETTLGWILSSSKIRGGSKSSVALSEISNRELNALCEELIMHGMDLVRMPINPEDYLLEQSAVYMEDGQARGVFLLKQSGEGIELSLLASFANNPVSVMDMINFTADRMRRFSEETKVTVNVVDERISKLIRHLNSMKDEDEEGFTKSERVTIDLSVIDDVRREAELMLQTWKEFETARAS